MPIVVNVDLMLAKRKMRLNTLAEKVGITPQNLSVLKTGRARAIRFGTLEALCAALECQPGDILSFEPGPVAQASGSDATSESESAQV